MRFMQRSKDSLAKWLSAILPVVIVGLVGLFAVTLIFTPAPLSLTVTLITPC